ncbi:MAG: site-specific DNA-methyltransferase [Oscillochloridaceae bacterium umkhey_bin13]
MRTFLNRELDFFIKSDVMRLDDIEDADAPRVEQYLAKVRAMRRIAHKIIDMLAQLETFQKRLWLKKKFVVETNYCVTLDRVPEELYPEIAANEAQREAWVRLFAIDAISGDLLNPGYSSPLTVDFLKTNPFLVLDTQFFSPAFKARLLASFSDLEAQLDGLLVHSENFQALNLLQERYREQVQCIYIDPPYNTNSSSIPYKNDYRHSSWASLMYDRVTLLSKLLKASGAIFVSIDKAERTILEYVLNSVFGSENRIEELIWSMNTNNSQAPNYSTNHEYVQVYAKDRVIVEQDRDMFREPKPGFFEVMELIQSLNKTYPPISHIEAEIRALYERHRVEYRDEVEAQGLDWELEKNNDPWRGLFNYSHAEYRDDRGCLVLEADAKEKQAKIWVWRESDASMPATKQSLSTYDSSSPNWRFYQPLHPITGKPCPHPKSGWKFAYNNDEESPDRRSFTSLDHDHRIVWGSDENKIPQLKRMLHEVETNVGKSVFLDYSDGEKQTSAIFGRSGVFLAPKHSSFVSRFILHGAKRDSLVVDCFAGSGTTGHAVINLNREDGGQRKYILVEMGAYFDTVLKSRLLKVIYSQDWKDGKPVSRAGSSHMLKYLRLESYEDTLNNLELQQSDQQLQLLATAPALREDYMLRYMLDVESRGSASLLNIDAFAHPFNYTLKVASGSVGATRDTVVDLVETFNYLLGLRVRQINQIGDIVTVQGIDPDGQRVLIIWRDCATTDNLALDEFFQAQSYATSDPAFDLIYVNGDNNLENLKRAAAIFIPATLRSSPTNSSMCCATRAEPGSGSLKPVTSTPTSFSGYCMTASNT